MPETRNFKARKQGWKFQVLSQFRLSPASHRGEGRKMPTNEQTESLPFFLEISASSIRRILRAEQRGIAVDFHFNHARTCAKFIQISRENHRNSKRSRRRLTAEPLSNRAVTSAWFFVNGL